MISDPHMRERLLIVGNCFGDTRGMDDLRSRLSDWDVQVSPSFLSAIADVSKYPASVVLACVDPGLERLPDAVGGLREAAGPDARLILCCEQHTEPRVRQALSAGADDYVIYPLVPKELDAALGLTPEEPRVEVAFAAAPAASMEELQQLGSILSSLDCPPRRLLERIAELIRTALDAKGAGIVVKGTATTVGAMGSTPVLMAPLAGEAGVIGQLTVSERHAGAYTPQDSHKLTHYATVIGHLLSAAAHQRQLRTLSVTDECSGMPNRRYFNERLTGILDRARTEQFHVTLLLFDLDDFKTYNDTYGHDVGDAIIRVTGDLIRRHCRSQDVVARYGGDEFAVVFWDPEGPRLAGSKHPDCALSVLGRFTQALQSPNVPELGATGVGKLTISGGLATFPWHSSTLEGLVKRADEALLAAKRAGKNRIFLIGEDETR